MKALCLRTNEVRYAAIMQEIMRERWIINECYLMIYMTAVKCAESEMER